MSQPLIGPVPYPDLPAQPTFPTWCVNWNAYDVPRLWDIVRLEDDKLGWEQINGFRQLSELLVDQYRRLRTQMTNLADAWRAPAADVLLSRLDGFSLSLLSDAHCAATTANALDGIMTTYANARMKIGVLENHWNNVTSDWVPEWWDQAAAELNTEAAKVMLETDTAVRDHRSRIIIPAEPWATKESAEANAQTESSSGSPLLVPAVPGKSPTVESDGGSNDRRTEAGGPWLAGLPPKVPAVPGEPVSMLPIPPGNSYVPSGGAYILPGPGVGPGGYVVSMPTRATAPGAVRSPVFGGGDARGANATNMVPMPMSSPAVGGQTSNVLYRRKANYVWHIDRGVPPVIKPVDDETIIPNRPSPQQEEAFKEWFAELAYPWRRPPADGEPLVVLRKVGP